MTRRLAAAVHATQSFAVFEHGFHACGEGKNNVDETTLDFVLMLDAQPRDGALWFCNVSNGLYPPVGKQNRPLVVKKLGPGARNRYAMQLYFCFSSR
ncbi:MULTISPECIES: hypothetical protein [Pseudomonas syringae group]|uniref:hypothetical protein n=1 Tax=Pseudomonas syringae group TaxID=136849 RepID=UPI0013C355EF|nr:MULTISPECIES: hypothetical protein [Pseudomonas syringae group]